MTAQAEPLKILLVEDNEADRDLLLRQLKTSGLNSVQECVDSLGDFEKKYHDFKPDLILCDFALPGFDAFSVLAKLSEYDSDVPLIVVTGTLSDETAVECLKKGAVDYLLKDKIVRLPSAIESALNLRNSRRQNFWMQRRLSDNEKQLRTVTDMLHALLIYIDSDMHITFCNRVCKSWLHRNPETAIGCLLVEVLGDSIQQAIQERMSQLHRGRSVEFESELAEGEATPKIVNVNLNPEIENGKLKGVVCLFTDISERKSYERELQIAKKAADAANQAKSLFLANVSHEMRTPLSAMMGFAEMLLNPSRSFEEAELWTEKIRTNCRHLKDMIDEILDLSKIEAGKVQIDKTLFPLADVIADVQSILLPLAKEKKINLIFKIDGSIPERVHTDQTKLRHILTNIIGNAIKFSQNGAVTATFRHVQSQLSILVEDQGRGIAKSERKRLFKPFSQADDSMTRQFGGTGLGLALSQRFAKALDGDVQLVRSELGTGSTFEIFIDIGKPDTDKMISTFPGLKAKTSSTQPRKAPADLHHYHILLVEDSEDNQVIIKYLLEGAGAAVDVASNGIEGLNKAKCGNYDLVFMDIQMPVLDGYGATTRLRRDGYSKPIVALTAHALKEERERCLSMGFDGFITKPIDQAEIFKEILKYPPASHH